MSHYAFVGLATLPDIPEGSHYITVYGIYDFPSSYRNARSDTNTVYFTVNDGTPPIVANLSIENKTYGQKDLSLNFTVDESTSWMGYSLDEQANVTIADNTTLTSLADGPHILTVYANDTVGNVGTSQSVNFNISTVPPLSISSTLASLAIIIVALSVVVLLRIKNRKEQSSFTHRLNVQGSDAGNNGEIPDDSTQS